MLPFCELHNWQDNFRWDPLIRLETASHDSRLQASAAGTRQPYHEMKTSFCSLLWLLQKPHKTLLITRPLKRQRMFPKPGCVCVCVLFSSPGWFNPLISMSRRWLMYTVHAVYSRLERKPSNQNSACFCGICIVVLPARSHFTLGS